MSYRILLSSQSKKFYKKLQRNVRARVREALVALEKSPKLENIHGELGGNYSLRVGKLRIIYHVSEKAKTQGELGVFS